MRITKIQFFLITISISFLYGAIIFIIFSRFQHLVLAASSSLVSISLLSVTSYHLSKYLFYKYYLKIVRNRYYLKQEYFANSSELRLSININYFKEELFQFFKSNSSDLKPHELFENLGIFVFSLRKNILEWDEIIILEYGLDKNKVTNIKIYYNFKINNDLEEMFSYFRMLDLLNFNRNNN